MKRTLVTLVSILLILSSFTAFAATTWDANTGTTGAQDGAGTWDTATANWWNGTADVVWPNTTSTAATIGAASGAAGTITVSGTVTLNAISFAAAGSGNYTLSGGTLSFGGTTPTISIAAALTPAINSIIGESSAGTAIKFTATGIGSGSITLGGANTFTGSPTVAQATVNYNSLANGGVASSFGAGANTVPVIVGNSGSAAAATYTGPAASTDRPFTINGAATGNTINNNGSGAVNFNNTGATVAGTAGNRTLTLGGAYTASANTFAQLLSDMPGFTTTLKIGSSSPGGGNTWTLTGANTHSGGTTLNSAGVLNIGNASALGTGPLTLAANGSFDNTTGGSITVANALTLSGGSPTYLGSANLTINGPVTLSVANRTITVNANTLTLGGQITGAFTLTKAGGGTLVLNNGGAADTHNGTLVSAGTLDLGGTSQTLGAVTFSGAATTQNGTINGSSYSGTLTGTGSGLATVTAVLAGNGVALTHSGSGTLALFGVNTYSGGTTISGAGTLLLTNDTGLGNASAGLTFSASGTLAATNNAAAGVTNTVTVGSSRTITVNSGFIANFSTPDTNNLTIAAKITGPGSVTKKSSSFSLGAVRFSNDTSDYAGDFTAGYGNTEFSSVAEQGTASSLGVGAAGTGGQINLVNATSSGTLRYVGAGNSSTHRPLILAGTTGTYTLDASGGGTVQFLAAANLKSGSGNEELRVRGTNTGPNTLAQVINDLGGVTWLNKFDSGTWVLSGANTFSGAVTNSGGVLQVNAAETPGTSGPLGNGGTLWFTGGTLQYSAANSFDYSARFSTTANQLYKIDCNGRNVTFATALTSSGGSLAISSSLAGGSLTLSTANTYSGATTVSSGTLLVNGSVAGSGVTVSGGTLGGSGAISSPVTVQSGGALQPGAGGPTIATLTVTGTLNLAGKTTMFINRSGPASSLVTGISTLTYGGTLNVTNLGSPLALGDTFTLFSASTHAGGFTSSNLPPLAAGLKWDTSQLAAGGNGTIQVVCDGTLAANAGSVLPKCAGAAVQIGGSPTASGGSGSGYTYSWSPATGLDNPAVANPNASPAATTQYTVTVTDAGGCTAQSQVTVTVNPAPATSAISGPGAVCAGQAGVAYSVMPTSGSTYAWSVPSGASITAGQGSSSISVTFGTNSGTVSVTETSVGGCVGSPVSLSVSLNSPPVLTTDTTNQTVCAGSEVTWSVTATGTGLTYQWQRDGTNLLEGAGNFTGTTGSVLTNSAVALEDALAATNGYVCIVSGTCPPATNSTMAALAVTSTSVGGVAAPEAAHVCIGTGTTISLSGQTGAIIGWESSPDNFTATTNEIASTANPLDTGGLSATTYYRAVVQSGVCSAALSSVAQVTVDAASVGGLASPLASHVCAGTGTTISLSGQTGAIVGWESSPDNFTATTNEIASTANPLSTGGLNATTYYRAIVQSGSCSSALSSVAEVIADTATAGSFTSSPNPSLPGAGVTFTATVTNAVAGCAVPTGNVLFKTNGVPLGDPVALDGSGIANLVTNSLPHGSNTVVAEYAGDGSNQGLTNSLVQVVNTPPTAPSTNAGVAQNQPLVLSNSKLLELSTDADGDTLAITAAGPTSTNGGTVTLTGDHITYQPVTNFVGMDLFSFVVSDPYGASATGTVLVTVSSANVPAPNIVVPPAYDNGSGTFSVTFAGIPDLTYSVQSAPSPTGPWAFLKTATAGTNGLFEVIDTELPPPPARYYRTTYP